MAVHGRWFGSMERVADGVEEEGTDGGPSGVRHGEDGTRLLSAWHGWGSSASVRVGGGTARWELTGEGKSRQYGERPMTLGSSPSRGLRAANREELAVDGVDDWTRWLKSSDLRRERAARASACRRRWRKSGHRWEGVLVLAPRVVKDGEGAPVKRVVERPARAGGDLGLVGTEGNRVGGNGIDRGEMADGGESVDGDGLLVMGWRPCGG